MTDQSLLGFVWVAAAALAGVIVLVAATAVVARKVGRVSVMDVTWGLGFTVVALVALAVGGGDLFRRIVLAVLVTVWGARLAWHIQRRNGGREDPRYEKLLEKAPGDPFRYAVTHVFALQGLLVWLIAMPLQVSAVAGRGSRWVLVLGAALWLVGVAFEAVGDAQLARFKADPAHHGKLMTRGLWAWTRHPNYFGDACVWWGLFVVAASAWPGVLTFLSPVAMTVILVWGTGARMTERTMAQRPGWDDYAARTSSFVPRPPR
ncbi:MAG TPA: DUF1295 domain-containing protein [Nocardioidaceae bacterium]|nr:DUF1295 domain-containing protein [Nocardioidaceae bacterium]